MTDDTPKDQVNPYLEAFRPFMEQITRQMQDIRTVLSPLIDLYKQHPELFKQVPDTGQVPGPCRCLCGSHPDRPGVCHGVAASGLAWTFHSLTAGTRQVPMCRGCFEAHRAKAQRKLSETDATGLHPWTGPDSVKDGACTNCGAGIDQWCPACASCPDGCYGGHKASERCPAEPPLCGRCGKPGHAVEYCPKP